MTDRPISNTFAAEPEPESELPPAPPPAVAPASDVSASMPEDADGVAVEGRSALLSAIQKGTNLTYKD